MLKIATWNVNSLRVRLPHVLEWLATAQPDVLAIQETKLTDDMFPMAELQAAGYRAVFAGQKTYNGVAIVSREPAADIMTDLPGMDDPQRRVLAVTINQVRIINLYIPNGESLASTKFQYKLSWLQQLHAFLQHELTLHPNLIVLGDFNIAPTAEDVHDPKRWVGHVLCSEPERTAFQSLLSLGLIDCFRQFTQPEKSFTWWDYRLNGFQRNWGLRIDHILSSAALATHCKQCDIDKTPRTWERPSDHTPVMAQFVV